LTQTDASGRTTYTWDARNRLVEVTGPTVSASFAYDALGRRVSKHVLSEVDGTVDGATTTFLYDGLDIVGETSGGENAACLRTLAIDEALTRTDSSGTATYLADILGSTVALADGSGTPVTTYTYEPFGTTSVSGSSSPNSFQFTGRENDTTGLYYYRARYYDPKVGRFLQQDPLDFGGGDVNWYAYLSNSPTMGVDPTGEAFVLAIPLAWPVIAPALVKAGWLIAGGTMVAATIISAGDTRRGNDDYDEGDCKERLSDWEINKRPPENAHTIKGDILGRGAQLRLSELCRCRNGDVVIRPKECKGPIIPTGYKL
jgi:RHS repeat-associated protein